MDMSPEEIRIRLFKKKVSQAKIASEIGVHPSMISRVIDGVLVSDRCRRAIADKIGVDVKQMWPSKYLGEPVRRKMCLKHN